MKSKGERGSALLIIFVLAASIAIMLYMEMPVAVFEAQRNKEQLLIDRGNEYAHAAKLYYRKIGQYPPSIDAMENTNRIRFLRKRYKDPFTGKDDWRLLHAAPNGMLTDSKVNPVNNNIAGIGNNRPNANNQSAGNSPFGGNSSPFGGSNSPFNSSSSSSGFGGFNASSSNSTASSTAETVVPALPQRRPAVSANGEANGAPGQETPAATDSKEAFNFGSLPAPAADNTNPNAQPNTPQTAANGQQTPGPNGTDLNNPQFANRGAGLNQNQAGTAQGASPFRLAPNSGSGSSSGLGVVQGSGGGGLGIAGVASKAEGHSIKAVNDQEKYSLWEFYYDPSKDAQKAAAGALAQTGGGQQQQGGIGQPSNSRTSSSSGFGNFGSALSGTQNTSGSAFGQQSGTTSGSFGSFGNSGTNNPNSFGNTSQTPPPSSTTANPPQQ